MAKQDCQEQIYFGPELYKVNGLKAAGKSLNEGHGCAELLSVWSFYISESAIGSNLGNARVFVNHGSDALYQGTTVGP
jgi:hypothetical protein